MHKLVSVLAAVFTCAVIAWVTDLFRKVGLLFYAEQFIAGLCSIVFPLIYLRIPARRRKSTFDEEAQPRTGCPPWYDVVAAVVGFACAAYIAIRFDTTELPDSFRVDTATTAQVSAVRSCSQRGHYRPAENRS